MNKKKEEKVFVGFFDFKKHFSAINIFHIAKHVNRSIVLRDAIDFWLDVNSEQFLEAKNSISKSLSIDWYKEKINKHFSENISTLTKNFNIFCDENRKKLVLHGIDEEDIESIMIDVKL